MAQDCDDPAREFASIARTAGITSLRIGLSVFFAHRAALACSLQNRRLSRRGTHRTMVLVGKRGFDRDSDEPRGTCLSW
eukprot:14606102-Alexandrium_andersonii.AAC.1